MSLFEDFQGTFGEDVLLTVMSKAGHHAGFTGSIAVGDDLSDGKTEKLVFGLLEILDYECVKYECFTDLTEEQIKGFLVRHKKEVGELNIRPPSYLGLMCGTFDFLRGCE